MEFCFIMRTDEPEGPVNDLVIVSCAERFEFLRGHAGPPLQRVLVPTGLYIALPEGYECQARPRSGLAVKHGISVLNSPGTIDADYRGELKTLLVNLSDTPFVIEPGERIAQLVVAKHEHVEWEEVEVLDETERGEGGFGSTGVQ